MVDGDLFFKLQYMKYEQLKRSFVTNLKEKEVLEEKGANNSISFHVKFFIFTDIIRRYYSVLCTIQLCAIYYIIL